MLSIAAVRGILSGAVCVSLWLAPARAPASGYHPEFGEALRRAELVVTGKVVEGWDPGKRNQVAHAGRAYKLIVTRAYKGTAKRGAAVIFWDRHHGSTAQYPVAEGQVNLLFLVTAKISRFEQESLSLRTSAKPYAPIRALEEGRQDEYDGFLYLLELTLRPHPRDPRQTYRKLLRTVSNPYVLCHLLTHWPQRLTREDAILFRALLKKHRGEGRVTGPIIEHLLKSGQVFDAKELVGLLERGDILERSAALKAVTSKNIAVVRDTLFGFIEKGELEETEAITLLARLARAYFLERLRAVRWTDAKLLPCLKAVGVGPGAVGRKGVPASMKGVHNWVLRQLHEIQSGSNVELHAVSAMAKRFDVQSWQRGLPMLFPLLTRPDNKTRRVVVALLRTYGFELRRQGARYVVVRADGSAPAPIALRLRHPASPLRIGQPLQLALEETALGDGAWISLKGELAWRYEVVGKPPAGQPYGGESGSGFGAWDGKVPREAFLQLRRGKTTMTTVKASLVDHPGKYRVRLLKFYVYDGASAGIDAWTGAVPSNEIVITVLPRNQ